MMGGPMMMGGPGMPMGGFPIMMGMPKGGMPGMPVMMEGQFGFDPWEDLHKNVANKVLEKAQPGAMVPHGHPMIISGGPSLEMQLGNILSMFGDNHAGHVGRAEGSFEVDDDHHSRIRISAILPGYKLNGKELNSDNSPLQVKVIGHRSVVVSGSQQMGPIVKTWQRSFALPKGAQTANISVVFQEKSGNLTVDIPRSNVTTNSTDDKEDLDDEFDGLPPVLRAMQQGLPGLVGELNKGHGPPRGGGFLLPMGGPPPDIMNVLNSLGAMHPRNHLPNSEPVPEDAEVTLVGCFEESQLSKAELKYYGEANAAAFAPMYWHARADHVPFFAMARHDEALGHAYSVRGFAHEDEKPKWGVYDGCGERCEDDPSRWCGCAHEPNRGFGSRSCAMAGNEKRFAVYKIVDRPNATRAKVEHSNATIPHNASSPVEDMAKRLNSAEATANPVNAPAVDAPSSAQQAQMNAASLAQQAAPNAGASHGRPYWQLAPSELGSAIEVMVPKGTRAQPKGNHVLFFNATEIGGSDDSLLAPSDHTAKPIGKVKLPAEVSPESCSWEAGRITEDGNQVLKCVLMEEEVQTVRIKVVDEL